MSNNSPPKKNQKTPNKSIELYYWPTPNGWKISIMMEECGLDYLVRYVDIGAGDQFKPDFLAISPNNRMPAIIDPEGPDGQPVAIFESGAILQYLGNKTGRFYPTGARARIAVDMWLFWQIGGLGPMAGQAHHFLHYAPEDLAYAKKRYVDECNRLYGVMNKQLQKHKYLAGEELSIADFAAWSWADLYARQEQDITQFPHLRRWHEELGARPLLRRGRDLGAEYRAKVTDIKTDEKTRSVLFGQRADS